MTRLTLVDSKTRGNREVPAHRASATEGEAAIRLLEDQGYPIKRIANGQAEISCPMHQGPGAIPPRKPTAFYINVTNSKYYCQSASCGERGNLKTLERFFGIGEDESFATQYTSREEQLRQYQQALTPNLWGPFTAHGLSEVTIERFRLGYQPAHINDKGVRVAARYVIPYLEARRPRWFRYYAPDLRTRDAEGGIAPGQADYDVRWKYIWEDGAQATLFNASDAMGDKDGRVILCEGELKAMMLVQMGYAAVAVPGATHWKDEFQAAFTHARHIVVCYDNDNPIHHMYDKPEEGRLCQKCSGQGLDRCTGHNPGQDAALARVVQLGWRAKNVELPLPHRDARKTDINDFFIRDGKSNADFALLATGKRATPFKVLSFAEITASPPVEAAFLIEQGILPKGGRLLVAGKPKVGKEQRFTTPVLTPTGWSTMGDLKVGDEVVGANGLPTTVTHLHPQGVKPIYRVTMSDGSSTECGLEHLWNIQTHNDRVYAKKYGRPRWHTVDTEHIIGLLAAGRRRDTYIPMVEPVRYESPGPLILDPYGLGLLLGDGSFTSTSVHFIKPDIELHEALGKSFPDQSQTIVNIEQGDIALVNGRGCGNSLIAGLRQLGLWRHRSWEKFIPEPYKHASIQDRLAILQGLLDTDGWTQYNDLGNSSINYGTSSERLKDDVIEIVESLGGLVHLQYKAAPKFQDGGVGRPAWSLRIRLPREFEPFRLGRKRDAYLFGQTDKDTCPSRRIVAVDYVDDDEAICITVANPNGLYVTERFIVTHNSIFVDNMALSLASGERFLDTFEVSHPMRTMLLDREMSKWSLFSRINSLTDDRPAYKKAHENLLIDHDFLLRFDQPSAFESLYQLVDENGAEVCILDTAYKFFAGDIESSSSLMKGFEVIDKVIQKTGCAFVLTHHLRKGQAAKGKENSDIADPDAVAGSFLWTGWPNATILLNFLNRRVEDPFNAICTFTAFRDHAAPEPLALYRNRESISYSAITPYSHEQAATQRPAEHGKPTTESVGKLLLELCPVPEDDFLHMTAAHFGVSVGTVKPYYLDAVSSGHFEKTKSRPVIVKYRYAEETETWEHEHHLPERPLRPVAVGASIELDDDPGLFDAAVLT